MRLLSCAVLFAVTLSLLLAPCVTAGGLPSIQMDKLPPDPEIRKVVAELQRVEPMVRTWSQEWRFEIPKEQVIQVLKNSLTELQKALVKTPENTELLLLTGLAAEYAYNLDIDGSFELAVNCLTKAAGNPPGDYRADWFLGNHLCHTLQASEGMKKLLDTEERFPANKLPADFWADYAYCAQITSMPAHMLRAGTLVKSIAPDAEFDSKWMEGIYENKYPRPDRSVAYEAAEVWSVAHHEATVDFTSTMFGISFTVLADWKVVPYNVKNSAAYFQIKITPIPGRTGPVIPNVLVIVRPSKPGESLDDAVKSQFPGAFTRDSKSPICPVADCTRLVSADPHGYKEEGDALGVVTAFQRSEPEFPGLLFEEPVPFPATGSQDKVKYFRTSERLRRLDGPLTYMILLDTAESVRPQAEAAYDDFLKKMRVE